MNTTKPFSEQKNSMDAASGSDALTESRVRLDCSLSVKSNGTGNK